MSVSWITGIYNNSGSDFFMWAVDREHLGVVHDASTGAEVGRCDGGNIVRLQAGGQFTAEWCGIPWYADEKHFRALSQHPEGDRTKALVMWQSKVRDSDGVVLLNGHDMRKIGGHEFTAGGEYRYALHIDPAREPKHGPFEISLELRNTDDTVDRLVNLLGKVVSDAYDDLRTLRVEAGKAAIGAAAGRMA